MSESCPAPQTARIPDPREVLDGIKRAKILALLTMGCSRRMAAKQAGFAASTITRTAERDLEFHSQIAEAEAQADVRALRLISRTAQQEKYWRVAAWMLERRNPDEYGRRAPFTFTGTQVEELLLRGLKDVVSAVPKERLPEVFMNYHDLLSDVAEAANLPPMRPEDLIAAMLPAPKEKAEEEQPPEPAVQRTPIAPRDVQTAATTSGKMSPAVPLAPSRNGSAAAKPLVEREECAAPRRTSCLERFVQRTPKRELQTAGTKRVTDSNMCNTFSKGGEWRELLTMSQVLDVKDLTTCGDLCNTDEKRELVA